MSIEKNAVGSGAFRLGWGAAASVVAALGIATPFVKDLEGRTLLSYLDSGGVPTICDGITKNPDGSSVKLGQTRTNDECDKLLAGELGKAIMHVEEKTETHLSTWQLAGLGSFTYNVGEGNFDRSSVLRKMNAGDVQGACDALLKWVYVKGKDCRLKKSNCGGIVRRREAERNYCLKVD